MATSEKPSMNISKQIGIVTSIVMTIAMLGATTTNAQPENPSPTDTAMAMAVSRCDQLGYGKKTTGYRDCVREQLRLLSAAPRTNEGVIDKLNGEPDKRPTTAQSVAAKKVGVATIGRLPSDADLVRLITGRRLLSAVATVNVCVDQRGKIIDRPSIVYSSLDESYDAAVIEFAKKGAYVPPSDVAMTDGGCVRYRVLTSVPSDSTPVPREIVKALVDTSDAAGRFLIAGTKKLSAVTEEGGSPPMIRLAYTLTGSAPDVYSPEVLADKLELWRSRVADRLCVDDEWAALFNSGVRSIATFTQEPQNDDRPLRWQRSESIQPSFGVLINAKVCERHRNIINANRGNKDAAYALGLSYRRGGVVWRENPETYFWFAVAERLGHEDGQRMKLEAAKYLNVPQIDRMKERLALWNPRP